MVRASIVHKPWPWIIIIHSLKTGEIEFLKGDIEFSAFTIGFLPLPHAFSRGDIGFIRLPHRFFMDAGTFCRGTGAFFTNGVFLLIDIPL